METLNAQAIMESQALTRLKHIQLELESNPMGRIEDLRRFADTWYCYTHGFVTRSLKADWHKIDFNRELTEGIVELIEEHTISGLKKMKSKLYVKKEHIGIVPGLQEYVEFFISDEIAGPGGPLSEYGLVPDPELAATRSAFADAVK